MAQIKFDRNALVKKITKDIEPWVWQMVDYDVFCLNKCCESPIEVSLGATMLALNRFDPVNFVGSRIILSGMMEMDDYRPNSALLIPQYIWQGYRIDFALRVPEYRFGWLFIECDGHDFHERTKEQAARDRLKDRAIQQSGIPVLRFTGSEIYKSPGGCAEQVFSFLMERMDDWQPPTGGAVGEDS